MILYQFLQYNLQKYSHTNFKLPTKLLDASDPTCYISCRIYTLYFILDIILIGSVFQTLLSWFCHWSGQYHCKRCESERKQLVGTGYSNLIAHLAHKHDGFKDQFAATLSSNAQSLQNFGLVSQETSDRFQWLRWVVERNMPLSEVDNELTRSMSSLHHIAKKVGVNLEVILGICFGIMFNRWSNGAMHLLLCTASSKQMAFLPYSCLLCRLSRTDPKMQMHTPNSSMVCWMCITRNSTWVRLSLVTTAVPTSQFSLSSEFLWLAALATCLTLRLTGNSPSTNRY
ncbi:hypothetical protein JG687_00016806 [Phytophthora cactorum]|uniref:BED-type domain-containing protein n=1 Tax=Phytophthora cactorum TaxID=29920 RepID=A0A8T1TTK1_9STRA|nr:hypothetical protein JG687_00016806 [Phytophthora cactorum]